MRYLTVLSYLSGLILLMLCSCDPGIGLLGKSTGNEVIAIKYPRFKAELHAGCLLGAPLGVSIDIWTTKKMTIFPDRLIVIYKGSRLSYSINRDFKVINNSQIILNDPKCELYFKCNGFYNVRKKDEIQVFADDIFLMDSSYYDIDTVTFYSPGDFR